MSMHLEKPYLTTTSYKKRKEKITKAKQAELEQGWRDRNQRLKQMGLSKETFEQYLDWVYGRGKKEKKETTNWKITQAPISKSCKEILAAPEDAESNKAPSSLNEWITGPVSSKPSPIYTGTKVKGIGTMHKSNAVPIFSDEEAIDISRMRR